MHATISVCITCKISNKGLRIWASMITWMYKFDISNIFYVSQKDAAFIIQSGKNRQSRATLLVINWCIWEFKGNILLTLVHIGSSTNYCANFSWKIIDVKFMLSMSGFLLLFGINYISDIAANIRNVFPAAFIKCHVKQEV